MIWSYYWVKHVEQYPLWPNQIKAIKAMDSRTYYRGIFRLLKSRTSLQSEIFGKRLRETSPAGGGKLRHAIRIPIFNNFALLSTSVANWIFYET